MNRGAFLAVCLASLAVGLGGALVAVRTLLPPLQIDATRSGAYTLSGVTRAALRDLPEPVTLELYLSRDAAVGDPLIRQHMQRIRDLARLYASVSAGKLRVVEFDPAPFSQAEDQALAHGLTPLATEAGAGATPVYLGARVRSAADESEVLPSLTPDRAGDLERAFTAAIQRVSGEVVRPRLGLITDLAWFTPATPDGGGNAIARELAGSYQVVPIAPDFASIPADIGPLLLLQPPPLSPAQQEAVAAHVARDGRALVILDPALLASVRADGSVGREGSAVTHLGGLPARWGFGVGGDVLTDPAGAIPVATQVEGRVIEAPNPLVFAAAALGGHGNGPAVVVAAPAEVSALKPAARVLVQAPAGATRVDAVRALSGETRSPEPASAGAPTAPAAALAISIDQPRGDGQPAGRIVVIGDADFLDDRFAGLSGGNKAWFLGQVDQLAGAADLAALRDRDIAPPRLAVIDRMQARAQRAFLVEQTRLREQVMSATDQVQALEQAGAAGGAALDPERAAALEQARDGLLDARRRLRAVEEGLRRDVERVKTALLVGTGLVIPGLVLAASLALSGRRQRRQNRLPAASTP